jgi:hypothetical protein
MDDGTCALGSIRSSVDIVGAPRKEVGHIAVEPSVDGGSETIGWTGRDVNIAEGHHVQ